LVRKLQPQNLAPHNKNDKGLIWKVCHHIK
jgi:hypothetical protein